MAFPSLVLMLKEARNRAGLTQLQLAERLGVARSRIGNYEIENRRPPLDLAEQWAEACGYILSVRLLPAGGTELGDLSEQEERLIRRLRALPSTQVEIVFRLAAALPGHDVAREGLLLQLELLERFARSTAVDAENTLPMKLGTG